MSKSNLNYQDVDDKIDFVIDQLADVANDRVDVPRMKELNNALKTKIFHWAKLLSYYQLNKRGDKVSFYEKK